MTPLVGLRCTIAMFSAASISSVGSDSPIDLAHHASTLDVEHDRQPVGAGIRERARGRWMGPMGPIAPAPQLSGPTFCRVPLRYASAAAPRAASATESKVRVYRCSKPDD